MNDGLADHLPLLVPHDLRYLPIALKDMGGSRSGNDSLRRHRTRKKIGANQRLDETVLAGAQVTREINLSRDRTADAIELTAQLSGNRLSHPRRRHRNSFRNRFARVEGDILQRLIDGNTRFTIPLQGGGPAPQ